MIFILGIIIGLLIAILILLLIARYQIPIHRNVEKLLAQPIISPYTQAYIAGMSEEESSFAATLPIEKEVKIL